MKMIIASLALAGALALSTSAYASQSGGHTYGKMSLMTNDGGHAYGAGALPTAAPDGGTVLSKSASTNSAITCVGDTAKPVPSAPIAYHTGLTSAGWLPPMNT